MGEGVRDSSVEDVIGGLAGIAAAIGVVMVRERERE
jgi:hypothetical protein